MSCSKSEPSPEPALHRVENVPLGIAIAALPASFSVTTNRDEQLELEAPGENGSGHASFHLAPEADTGVNIVAAAEESKGWFEAQPDGQYFGNLELMTPIGSAYTARGSYTSTNGPIEELKVFALHPSANRLLEIRYLYPAGEGKERMQQIAELLGEIEALADSPQDAAPAAEDS